MLLVQYSQVSAKFEKIQILKGFEKIQNIKYLSRSLVQVRRNEILLNIINIILNLIELI